MTKITRRSFAALGACSALTPLVGARAQSKYPDRPVHVVLGFPAGSGADILARYYAHQLEVLMKEPVIIDNKPGATSNIALRFVQRAEPDGYTILFIANSNMAGSPYLFKDLPFDTVKDYSAIASFAQITFILVVAHDSKFNTLGELIAAKKAKKDNIYGYTNQTAQLSTELFKQMTGVPAKPVSYKTAPDAMKDILDGTLDLMIMDGTFAAGQVRQGLLKGLAVTTPIRSPTFPNVPTMQEAGLAGFDFAPWWGAYYPAKAPQPMIDQVAGYFHQIAQMPETAKFLESVGAIGNDLGPAATAARLVKELPTWEALVKSAGIEPQ